MSQLSQFIAHHWIMILSLCFVALLIIINEWFSSKQQAEKLSPQRLVNLMNHDDVKVFDLRSNELYKSGHIVNAQQVSKDDFNKAAMQKLKDIPFALVCDTGIHSSARAADLKKNGFQNVMVLQGGMRSWQEADLPLVKGK